MEEHQLRVVGGEEGRWGEEGGGRREEGMEEGGGREEGGGKEEGRGGREDRREEGGEGGEIRGGGRRGGGRREEGIKCMYVYICSRLVRFKGTYIAFIACKQCNKEVYKMEDKICI